MIYVGIDVAKLYHFASVISAEGEVLVGPFEFKNDGDGFQYLVDAFYPFDDEEIIIGLESTAHYGDNLVRYLVAEGYKVCVINPIQTSILWKNNSHKTWTDKLNTYIITNTATRTL
jgi:transposase